MTPELFNAIMRIKATVCDTYTRHGIWFARSDSPPNPRHYQTATGVLLVRPYKSFVAMRTPVGFFALLGDSGAGGALAKYTRANAEITDALGLRCIREAANCPALYTVSHVGEFVLPPYSRARQDMHAYQEAKDAWERSRLAQPSPHADAAKLGGAS